MTRNPLPRFIADVNIAVVVAASTEEEAEQRLDALADVIQKKLRATTITRMPGRPEVEHIELGEISVH